MVRVLKLDYPLPCTALMLYVTTYDPMVRVLKRPVLPNAVVWSTARYNLRPDGEGTETYVRHTSLTIIPSGYNLRPDGEGTETTRAWPPGFSVRRVTTYDPMVRVLKQPALSMS